VSSSARRDVLAAERGVLTHWCLSQDSGWRHGSELRLTAPYQVTGA
jgi:hypothetical protein